MKTICPSCGHEFNAKRSTHGAADALEWTQLPKWHRKFLQWWIDEPLLSKMALKKDQMRGAFKYVGMSAINARISELLALDLVTSEGNGKYRINEIRAKQTLSDGRILSNEVIME